MATAESGETVAIVDEEFQHHLARGNEQLAAGDPDGARESLRRAAALLPDDPPALAALGQACYRAGLFEEAAVAYGRVVDDAPAEVSARVNLGLARLKGQHHAEAVKQFSIALDLDPEHRKAMGYLGLALLESGDPRSARPWLERAGSTALVARCEAMLAAQGRATPPPAPPAAVARPSPTPTPRAAPTPTPLPHETPAPVAGGDVDPLPQVEVVVRPSPTPLASPSPLDESAAPRSPLAPGGLGAFAAQRTVQPPPEPFAVDGSILHVAVRGELVCRVDGLFAVRGTIAARPEVKRFRGRATEKPFGTGRERMHRMTGEGALFFRTAGFVFTVVDLAGDAGYFREGAVFALEEPVVYENGRVPSRHSRDLDLVHLRGRGRLLVRTAAAPVAIEVSAAEPLRVPPAALVGWTGAVTPRVALLGPEESGGPGPGTSLVVVELAGDGRVFVDPDAATAE